MSITPGNYLGSCVATAPWGNVLLRIMLNLFPLAVVLPSPGGETGNEHRASFFRPGTCFAPSDFLATANCTNALTVADLGSAIACPLLRSYAGAHPLGPE
ncbi:hypothetical protein BJ956_002104 [Arthrobacter psychrochitiniphilus]|nr:hypothetical protein [Arthrobacter psychrochitiniphilus]